MSERQYIKITDLKDMLKKSGKQYADKIAYQIKTKEGNYQYITHKEVRQKIDALGTALVEMGLKDKRIAVIGENRWEWEIAYLSIVCGTGTVVPLDKSLPENELKNLIERSEVEAIFYTKKYETILENAKNEGIGQLKHLISMDLEQHTKGIYAQKELIEKGEQLIKQGNQEFIKAKIDHEKMSIMLFTSGTTSASKIVALSHKNLCSNLMDIASILDVDCEDVFLSFLPLHHVFECTVGFLFALYKGAKTVFCDGIRHIPENMKEYKVSVMASVPAIYERIFKMIRKHIENQGKLEEILQKEEQYKNHSMEEKRKVFQEIHDMLGGNIKLLISGAASLDSKIEEKYRLLGLNIVQGYGLTETSPVIAIGTNQHYKLGSIGKCVPSVKAKIINTNQEGIGELIVQGPNIMLEYFGNRMDTKKALVDGWFYTGDLAKIDDEGYIFICGRKKSVIVLKNGKNIFPEEMENLINRIEGIEESFVFGKQMSEDKNDIKIFAKLVYNQEIIENTYKVHGEDEIFGAINEKIKEINKMMPHYKAIKGIVLTQEPLIKTTTNKIKRQQNLEQMRKEEMVCN
ncbi:MAG: AMP-binding protein [Clostridia bacterium]|nr:AMP-binding protein [Clostridia bacterium]